MKLIQIDIPIVSNITRLLRTPKYKFPFCPQNIAMNFISMLELAYKGKQAMLETVRFEVIGSY